MNNISIFKMDTEISEDIEDLQFFLREELGTVEKELADDSSTPLNIVNFKTGDNEDADYSLIFLGNYIVWCNVAGKRFDIVEIDVADNALYIYNLKTTDTKMLEMLGTTLSEITKLLNKSMDSNKLINYVSSIPLSEFLLEFLGQYDILSDIIESDVEDMILWLNGSEKKLH